jgi:hypothetical protein
MATQSGENSPDLILRSMSKEAECRYRLTLEYGTQRLDLMLSPIEHEDGIRAVEDGDVLFHFLSDIARLDASRHIFALVWELHDGRRPVFPLLLDPECGPKPA